jgi:hypothetical protein
MKVSNDDVQYVANYGVSLGIDKEMAMARELVAARTLIQTLPQWTHQDHDIEDDCKSWGNWGEDDCDNGAPYPEKCTCGITKIIEAQENYRKVVGGK